MYAIAELSSVTGPCGPGKRGPQLVFSIFYDDDAFAKAAATWRATIIAGGILRPGIDELYEMQIATEGDFDRAWRSVSQRAVASSREVRCGHILSHASLGTSQDGLEFRGLQQTLD